MEHKQENNNNLGYMLSEDGTILLNVTNAALDENGHFTIPYGVTSIGFSAFYDCTSLTKVDIPESVTSIEGRAFFVCISLTTVDIPNSVTSIGEWDFFRCTSLTKVHIPESMTSIVKNAFASCKSLTTVHISEGVTSIEEEAFYGCTGLTTVDIPNSVTSIEVWAFEGCTSLTHIIIDTDDEAEFNRIKNLLLKDLRDKVISRSVYEIQRNIVGNFFNHALSEAGLPVTDVNQIITSYLSEPLVCILGAINQVRRCTFLPNDGSKLMYRDLLAQTIGRFFPDFYPGQATDQKQHADERRPTQNTGSTLRLTLTPASQEERLNSTQEASSLPGSLDHPVDEKESSAQGQPGSTPPTPELFQSGAPVSGSQPVVPTRGRRGGEETNMCCVMQ